MDEEVIIHGSSNRFESGVASDCGNRGRAGQRTFFRKAAAAPRRSPPGHRKEQAALLGGSLESFLEELDRSHPPATREAADPVWMDMRLREPVEELFRVGNMGLGYSEDEDLVVLIAYELVEEGDDPNVVSFWATRPDSITGQAYCRHC